MPADRRSMRLRDRCYNDPGQEDRIQRALEAVNAGVYRSFKLASEVTGVSQTNRFTIRFTDYIRFHIRPSLIARRVVVRASRWLPPRDGYSHQSRKTP